MQEHDQKKLFVPRESVDAASHFFIRIRIKAGKNLTLEEAAARILLVTTQRTMDRASYESDASRLEHTGRITHVDSAGNIELAIPDTFCTRHEGLTHLLTLIGTPAEYNYANQYWVTSIELSSTFVDQYRGPWLGIDGIRKLTGVYGRPLLGATVKPRVGTSIAPIVEAVREAVRGGADFFVDDLLLVDPPGDLSFERRLVTFTQLSQDLTEELGRSCTYWVNVGGGIQRAHKWAERAIEAGAGGILLNSFTMGIGSIEAIAYIVKGRAPIICTNMGSGLMSRGGFAMQRGDQVDGLSEGVLAKLSRLAGADAVHTGTSASECFGEEAWGPATGQLQCPLRNIRRAMAVAEGDITVANLWNNIKSLGTDMLVEATTGIFNAPGGPRAGAAAFRMLLENLRPEMSDREAKAKIHKLGLKHHELLKVLEAFKWNPH